VIFVYNKRRTLNRVNLAIRYEGICGALETERRGRRGPRSGPSSASHFSASSCQTNMLTALVSGLISTQIPAASHTGARVPVEVSIDEIDVGGIFHVRSHLCGHSRKRAGINAPATRGAAGLKC